MTDQWPGRGARRPAYSAERLCNVVQCPEDAAKALTQFGGLAKQRALLVVPDPRRARGSRACRSHRTPRRPVLRSRRSGRELFFPLQHDQPVSGPIMPLVICSRLAFLNISDGFAPPQRGNLYPPGIYMRPRRFSSSITPRVQPSPAHRHSTMFRSLSEAPLAWLWTRRPT